MTTTIAPGQESQSIVCSPTNSSLSFKIQSNSGEVIDFISTPPREDLEMMSSPEVMERIRKGQRDIASGRTKSTAEIRKRFGL